MRTASQPGGSGSDPWAHAARIVAGIREPRIPDRSFQVAKFGARPGAEVDSRPAIQATIDACAGAGGGRVVIPAGLWHCDGPLRLRSRLDLHLERGAHLRFSGNAASYLPVVLTRWEGTELWNYSPMILGSGLRDVSITGPGTIDGQGEANFLPWRPKQRPDQDLARQMGHDGVPVEKRVFGAGHWLRPQFIQFYDCRNVLVDGPRIVDSPFWVIHVLYCDQAIVRNVAVVSRHINSDGVDVDSSTNVLVEDCRFEVGDDGVAIKSGRDQDGWRVARPSRDVVVRRCEYLGNTGGALAIGSEMSGGVHDVYVEGYRMERSHHALYFKSNLDRGGVIERVFIRDVTAGEVDCLLIFTSDYHSYRGGDAPTRFENVTVERVSCRKARIGLSIVGHPRAPVRDVALRRIRIDEAQEPFQIRHVEQLGFEDVTINGLRQAPPVRGDETRPIAPVRH